MPHVFEPAATGRAKCRGCRQAIAKGELRFGESLPNPFGEGEVTHWFHPACAAYKRPEALLEGLAAAVGPVADRERLARVAAASLAQPRLARIDGAERSPSGQARCRSCHEPIERGSWRLRLAFHEEGSFSPGGFLHVACRRAYFETGDIVEQVLHFSPALEGAEREALRAELARDA
jgi:poly [ADP-ribose] polymerase